MIFAVKQSLFAQELGYSGVSPVNSSFGGVAVAAPIDGNGAMYWNPATINFLDKGQFQFGFGRTSPPWYGDESLGYTILIPVAGILWLLSESDDKYDDMWGDNSSNSSGLGGSGGTGSSSSSSSAAEDYYKIPKARGFNMCFVGIPSQYSHWNFGLSMTEMAQRKRRYIIDSATGQLNGVQVYRVRNIELVPALSLWNKRNLSFGISPIFSIDEHPNSSLPSSPGYTFLGDERGHLGLGLQLGAFYKTDADWNFGFSVKSPIWIPGKMYCWENTSTSELRVRRSNFSQDSPLRLAVGISYTGFTNALFAVDVRHYDFQHVSSLYDFSPNDKKRIATSLGAGVQYELSEGITLRIGYQYTDGNCSSFEDLVFNTTLPIQRGHSMHYGITLGSPESWDITFSGSHTFGEQKIQLPDGSMLGANPNNSAFWWGLRFHF